MSSLITQSLLAGNRFEFWAESGQIKCAMRGASGSGANFSAGSFEDGVNQIRTYAGTGLHNWAALDIETAKIVKLKEGQGILDHRPLGIACAVITTATQTYTFFGKTEGGHYAPQMSRAEVGQLIEKLTELMGIGYRIVTWNGTSFDWNVLAEESGQHDACVMLALHNYDPCFQMHCLRGLGVSLQAVAKGFGMAGKTENMSGAMAPSMWAENLYDEVLSYCTQDALTTMQVMHWIERTKVVQWTSESSQREVVFKLDPLTVQECLDIPKPDTSWMKPGKGRKPRTREQQIAWMKAPIIAYEPVPEDDNIKVDPYTGEIVA